MTALMLPENNSLSKKLVRNTLYNILGKFWGVVITIFLTPYIIQRIGVERYGIWAIVGIITGYFGLLDFGIGLSFVKYIAEFYTKKDYPKINDVVNCGLIFYLLFAIFIIILSLIFINPLLSLFKIPVPLLGEAKFVFLAGIFLFLATNAIGSTGAVVFGLQRMDLANKLAILVSIPNILGTIFFLEKGYGLPGLMVNNIIIFIISALVTIAVCYKIFPEFKLNIFRFNKEVFRKLFGFGWRIQIAKVSGVVSNQTDKTILANYLSLGLVTFYQLGSYVINCAIILASLLGSALMPAFSELEARGEKDTLINAYLKSTKYLAIIVIPTFIFLFVAASRIMFMWMGLGYEKASLTIQILAIAWMFRTITQSAESLSIAINKPQLLAAPAVIITFLNIALSLVLIKKFGFYGAAWGTALAVNSGAFYFMVKLHKSLKVSLWKITGAVMPYLLSAIFAGMVIYGMDEIPVLLNIDLSRFSAMIFLFIQALIFSAVYLAIIYFARLFDIYDYEFIELKFPKVYRMIKFLLPRLGRG